MRLACAGAVLGLMLAAAACGDDPTSPSGPPGPGASAPAGSDATSATSAPTRSGRTIRVVVAGGEVVEGEPRYDVRIGETVRIEVVSDAADEVHVHGYDQEFDVGPGRAGALDLRVRIPGTVEVELHDAGLKLFQLRAR